MAEPLEWKEGEGYDIHVLRGGPSSKALDESLKLDPDGLLPSFQPHFKGAPNNHGVTVDRLTGEVTATAQPASPNPQFPNFNFLLTARQTLVGNVLETIIRIHIHDSIKKIWLTPSALTIHQDAPECRFTVLALFDDDTVGDITDWPQLAYSSSNKFSVDVQNVGDIFQGEPEIIGGRLFARPPGDFPVDNPDITVDLKLASPPTDLSGTAKVFPKPGWADLGKDLNTTKVEWVGGKMRPDPKQSDADKLNSIESVVSNGRNILFVSEGFLASQEKDFRQKIVDAIVNSELRVKESLQPFKLLADSINYWSVFVESREESVGLLGDCRIDGKVPKQTAAEVPLPRPPTQSQWSVENMIHEAGLPLPLDAAVPDLAAWLASRAPLYDLPTAVTADAKALKDWNDLRQRLLLNERDSAFGFAHHDRPRASGQGRGEENLVSDRRRTSKESIGEFVRHLRFANHFELGSIWGHESGTDRGLVCFVCQSGKIGGGATPVSFISGAATVGFFTASTGKSEGVPVKPATVGIDIVTPAIGVNFSPPIVASVVAHECGHAFGLGDEYGDLVLGVTTPPVAFDHPNLQQEAGIVFPSGAQDFDVDNIQWLWPRISKTGVLVGPPDDQGNPQANQLLVRLRANHGKPFVVGDLVRIRKVPVRKTTEKDQHARVLFKVVLEGADSVTVEYVTPSGARLDVTDPDFSDPAQLFTLNCTSFQPGIEHMLVADPIKNHIATSDRPLNAPLPAPGSPNYVCVPGGKPKAAVTPTNLPALTKTPANLADIIGLYDGGGYRDCGVFRPTGQCKMRSVFDKTALFCHVCRYIIVDTVDPTKHAKLDKFYPAVQP